MLFLGGSARFRRRDSAYHKRQSMNVARSMQDVRTGLAEEKTHSRPRLPRYDPPPSAIISTDTIYFDINLGDLVYMMPLPVYTSVHNCLSHPVVSND
jgi:hypothetical protein